MNFKYVLCLSGIFLALPILAVIAITFPIPITISGIGYLLAISIAIAGLILAPWVPKYRSLIVIGLLALALIVVTRIALGELNSKSNLRMVTLPQEKGTRWLSYVLDEQDSLIFGETLFHFIGGSSAKEHENITEALYQDYIDLRQAHGIVPSPIINTYLTLQRPSAFDAVVIEPKVNRHPDVGVIFLHGFMGNVTAQCWEIAHAVDRFGAVTTCPSAEWQGKWWYPEGETILRSTFQYLREQGIQTIYLGGFSNGGFGISRLASKLGAEDGLSGLILIDGMTDAPGLRSLGIPILLIQGTQDERMPVTEARQIAEELGKLGTYVEIDSDHFLIMKEPQLVQNAIQTWLEAQTKQ
ncbi:MAG: hypothetical protein IPP66_22800 [Anaerolineales bacterium]|nr:hypothetical protein [Anaerolineales bacterium]